MLREQVSRPDMLFWKLIIQVQRNKIGHLCISIVKSNKSGVKFCHKALVNETVVKETLSTNFSLMLVYAVTLSRSGEWGGWLSEAQTTKTKTGKFPYIELQWFFVSKETVEWKRQYLAQKKS